jgi:serine/threonine-protein kinase
VNGRRGDARSDVYALGVLMYQLLTGRPPLCGTDLRHTKHLHLTELPRPLGRSGLWPIVDRCLAKDPSARFGRGSQLRGALNDVLKRLPPGRLQTRTEVLPAAPVDPFAGKRLGPYQLEKIIGEGAMGRVFLARHARLDRRVAIKVLRPELALQPSFVHRFFQEARAVNQINHQHIVEILDFVEEQGEAGQPQVYCVMEYLAGSTLTDILREGSLSLSRLIGIARQICSALQAAHDAGVIHRDIKPDNIFITSRPGQPDFVKVLDFGVAKLRPPPGAKSADATSDGLVVGTPTYMAPEQVTDSGVDCRADLYSLGVVLYRALAGRPPFRARSFGELLLQIQQSPPPPLAQTAPNGEEIPRGLDRAVMRCLEKDATRRFDTMNELSAALAPFESISDAPVVPSRRRRRRAMVASGAVVGLLALGWGAMALLSSPHGETRVTAEVAPRDKVLVTVTSSPPGATVLRLDTSELLGKTPLEVRVDASSKPISLRWEKPGYEGVEQTYPLNGNVTATAQLLTKTTTTVRKPVKPKRELANLNEEVAEDEVLNPFAK